MTLVHDVPSTGVQPSEAATMAERLVAELEGLPAHESVALHVVSVANAGESSARDLAAAISADPSLTAKVMKLANSAYYGLSGRVGSASFAVTVLGFATVGTLAASQAAGVSQHGASLPDGFWEHATLTAAAATLLSPRFGVNKAEAFSGGLLHDLGRALLHRVDREAAVAIDAEVAQGKERWPLERQVFGMDHPVAAARVLTAWRFPEALCTAIEVHHRAKSAFTPFAQLLVGASAVARHVRGDLDPAPKASHFAALEAAGIDDESLRGLAAGAARDAQALIASFAGG